MPILMKKTLLVNDRDEIARMTKEMIEPKRQEMS